MPDLTPSAHRAMRRAPTLATLLLPALLFAGIEARAVSIQFDYRFDSQGFFSTATADGLQARSTLEEAADTYARYVDSLAPITPGGGDTWSTGFLNPGGSGFVNVNDLAVPADTLVVFVGARPLVGALGFAFGGGVSSATGSAAFLDALETRGQAGALLPIPNDHGVWGGSITFNSAAPWNLDPSTLPGPSQNDFLTTAIHEIGHIFGFGSAPSFAAQVVDDDGDPGTPLVFVGDAASAAYGGPVPLGPFGGHFAEGVSSFVDGIPQETLMDPTTPAGVRQLATDLDHAVWQDIGWTPIPEPSAGILLGLGLVAVAWGRRTNA